MITNKYTNEEFDANFNHARLGLLHYASWMEQNEYPYLDKPEILDRVKHYGYVREAEKQALIFSAADAFLCPTLADGQPQTVLESLACGTPVIVFDVGPMPDLVENDKTGRIAPDKTSQSLLVAIQEFYEQDDLHPFMQDYCRKEARQKYDLAKQTKLYVDLYEKILKEKKPQN
jgi:glycosyltransferase involved in cell wall biosynthesis